MAASVQTSVDLAPGSKKLLIRADSCHSIPVRQALFRENTLPITDIVERRCTSRLNPVRGCDAAEGYV